MTGVLPAGAEILLVGLAGAGLLLGRIVPRAVVLLWAVVLVLVPYWVAADGPILLPACVLASAAVVAATVGTSTVPRLPDAAVAGFVLLLLLAAATGAGRTDEVVTFVAGPLVAYAAGRAVTAAVPLRWIYAVLGGVFAIVTALAVVEALTGFNPFLDLGPRNSLAATWAEQRWRGGQVRPEASFGSSIALGTSIAMTVPLVWGLGRSKWWRAAVLPLMVAASVLTLSRIAMATTLLAVLTTVLLSRDRLSPRRVLLLVAAALPVGVVAALAVKDVFEAAGEEAADSAAYRTGLQGLIPSMRWLGLAGSVFFRADGVRYFGPYRSIDSQLILMGLLHGLLPLLLLLVPLVLGALLVATGRASAPTIAVVCQLPALGNVALITQYETYFWFLVGLAVTVPTARAEAALVHRRARCSRDAAPPVAELRPSRSALEATP